jgi:peroxygenase
MIYPWDTYNGFRDLGFNIIFSLLATFIINVNFSYPTRLAYSWIPDPWFRVYVPSVHKAKVCFRNLICAEGEYQANIF